MDKKTAAITVFALLLTVVCPVAGRAVGDARGPLGEREIRARVEQAPDEGELPEADALVLFEGVYVSRDDGKISVRHQRLIKVYTEYVIDELGDPRLAYDSNRQELEIHASRTYLLDGSTMDTPDNGYNEVTPFGLDLSADHLDIREMVVTHVGLERGVSILLDWTVRDVAEDGLPFNRTFFLHDEFPALEKELVASGEFWGETVNPPAGLFTLPDPERSGEVLVWRAEDLAQRPSHADNRQGDQVPWIALSVAPSWEVLLAELGESVSSAALTGPRLEAVLAYLEKDEPFLGQRDALERIAQALQERTALIRYRPWTSKLSPRSAEECLLRSTATPIERCVLVMAACRLLGLEAALGLPAEWQSLTRAVPGLGALGNPLVRVSGEGSATWWIDAVEGEVATRVPIAGAMPYFIVAGGRVERHTAPEVANLISLSVFWDLDAGKAKVDGSISGPVAEDLNWQGPEDLLEDWAGAWCDSAGAGGIRVLASGPEGITYVVDLDAPLPSPDERGRVVLELPMPPCDIHDVFPPALNLVHSEVDGVMFPPAPARLLLVWRLRLPDGYLLLPGVNRETELDGGLFSLERTDKDSMIEVEYRFEWDGRAVRPADYPPFRQMILDALDHRLTQLVFAEEDD